MSAEDVEIVRRSFETLLATGEPDWAEIDEQVEVYDHDIPDQAGYRGHDGVGKWLRGWGDSWEESTYVPQEFIDVGDRVVAVVQVTARGRGSGIELQREDGIVYELRAGKITRIDYYNDKRLALEAAGVTR